MGKRLTSENGETLTELLISVLVIALGLSMFAAALTASRKMLILGTEKIETYYSERNDLEGEKSEKEAWGTLTVEETGGKMQVQSRPCFRLMLSLWKGENDR